MLGPGNALLFIDCHDGLMSLIRHIATAKLSYGFTTLFQGPITHADKR